MSKICTTKRLVEKIKYLLDLLTRLVVTANFLSLTVGANLDAVDVRIKKLL